MTKSHPKLSVLCRRPNTLLVEVGWSAAMTSRWKYLCNGASSRLMYKSTYTSYALKPLCKKALP